MGLRPPYGVVWGSTSKGAIFSHGSSVCSDISPAIFCVLSIAYDNLKGLQRKIIVGTF
jgi:hypothetical protein